MNWCVVNLYAWLLYTQNTQPILSLEVYTYFWKWDVASASFKWQPREDRGVFPKKTQCLLTEAGWGRACRQNTKHPLRLNMITSSTFTYESIYLSISLSFYLCVWVCVYFVWIIYAYKTFILHTYTYAYALYTLYIMCVI